MKMPLLRKKNQTYGVHDKHAVSQLRAKQTQTYGVHDKHAVSQLRAKYTEWSKSKATKLAKGNFSPPFTALENK